MKPAILVAGGVVVGLGVLGLLLERGAFRGTPPEDTAARREVTRAASPTERPAERAPVPQPALPPAAPSDPVAAERPSARNETKLVFTQMKAQKYVEEAYPAWLRAHPGQDCPHNLSELSEYTTDKDVNDAWGRPMRLRCTGSSASGGKRVRVTSFGRDGERSEDDIHFGD